MDANDELREALKKSTTVHEAMDVFVVAMEQGYLRGELFEVVASGNNEEAVKAFLAGPFAEMRAPFSRWLALAIARFPDNAETEALAHNLSDEYGEAVGKSSHAALYRRLLDELSVEVEKGKLSTPTEHTSQAAADIRKTTEQIVASESLPYILGFFAGFEATDGPDFKRLGAAVRRMWPERPDLHEFFETHANSQHGATFTSNLQPIFEQQKTEFTRGMRDFLRLWEQFYSESSIEVGLT